MFLWRLAALTGRALVINQTYPAPLEMFLKPTGIVDWLPDPRIKHPNGAERYDQHQVMWPKVKNGTFSDIKDPLILWETNGGWTISCMLHAVGGMGCDGLQ
jgi:hypothetical protein